MIKISLTTGALLIILGLAGYLGTGAESITAMIPAFFGVLIVIAGFLARKEHLHRHMMHGVMAFALLGFLGSVAGVVKVMQMLAGQDLARPAAAISQTVMAVICLVILIPGIKSFITARKNRVDPGDQA